MDQLPDLFVGQAGEGVHAAMGGTVPDNPEQLSICQGFHGFRAGEVPRRRVEVVITGFGFAVAVSAVTGFAGDGLPLQLVDELAEFKVPVVPRQRILQFQKLFGSAGSVPVLWTVFRRKC